MSRYGLNNTRTNLDTEHTDATLQILTVYFALQEYCSQVKASLVVFLYLSSQLAVLRVMKETF